MGELNYLPTIVDRTFGDYYRDFTVDYQAVIQRMRDEVNVIYQLTKAGELQEAAALRAFIDTARQTLNGETIEQDHETNGKRTTRLLGIESIKQALAGYFAPVMNPTTSEITEYKAYEQLARNAEIDTPHTLISVQYQTFNETKAHHE